MSSNICTATNMLWWRKMMNVEIRSKNARAKLPSSNLRTKALAKPQHVMTENVVTSPPGQEQIGIVNFLKGKNYFVTGSTGFLAKVLIEKMLRSVSDVGKMYLLIKAKDKEDAINRLKNEIIDCELFKCVREKHGKSYGELMMRKLVPVVGDISKPGLGLDAQSVADIVNHVDVIISCAANTRFDERFDVALNTNSRGPGRLMTLAKKCKKLSLLLHISTAYANGEREGVVREKALVMGQSIAGERNRSTFPNLELDLDAEIQLGLEILKSVDEKQATQTMKDLGLQRAKRYGWQNVYVFSKAMGEMVINSMREDIPVVIIRPSVVESTYKEPFPGWIQGNRMLDPLILSYAKGILPAFSADPKTLIDVVPADMVANATMAAMAKHGITRKPEVNVYHVTSSVVNPLDLGTIFKISSHHFTSSPLMDSQGKDIVISKMEFLSSVDEFSSYISDRIMKQCKMVEPRVEKMAKKKAEQLVRMAKLYEPYMFFKGWFDNGNTEKMIEEMSAEEKVEFGFDMRSIKWRHFFMNIHIPGLKRHVMMIKDTPNST